MSGARLSREGGAASGKVRSEGVDEELLDVVDELDRPVGRLTRAEVHRRLVPHRAVHVFLRDPLGRLLLQKRSMAKDESPGLWTSSASGHVDAGETYVAAAYRELREELGIDLPLRFVFKLPAGSELANEHTALFEARCRADTAGSIRFPPEEITEVRWVTPSELDDWLRDEAEMFAAPFRTLWATYRRWRPAADR